MQVVHSATEVNKRRNKSMIPISLETKRDRQMGKEHENGQTAGNKDNSPF